MLFLIYIFKKKNLKYVDSVSERDNDDYNDLEFFINDCG